MQIVRPLAFFDLETTGTNTSEDKIVQMAILKINMDQSQEFYEFLINPNMNIPASATAIHGITNEMVAGKQKFSQLAHQILEILRGCDLAGHNSNGFDVPMLIEEFNRCKILFPEEGDDKNYLDTLQLERQINGHKLHQIYKKRTGKELENAHSAGADIKATAEIFFHQLHEIDPTGLMTVQEIDEFTQGENKRIDIAGKLKEIDGVICWSFGKHKNKPVIEEKSYAGWVLSSDFPHDTKKIIRKILDE